VTSGDQGFAIRSEVSSPLHIDEEFVGMLCVDGDKNGKASFKEGECSLDLLYKLADTSKKEKAVEILLLPPNLMFSETSMNAAKGIKLGASAFGAAFAARINRKMQFIQQTFIIGEFIYDTFHSL
jgi:hypothetical protein